LVANYIGKLWNIASIYLFIPLYIKYLGIDAYGVIAFYSILLAIILIADAGLSSVFAREVARRPHEKYALATLLKSLEGLYVVIILVRVISVFIASGWIASSWLKPSQACLV
jgi:hypothetical protein